MKAGWAGAFAFLVLVAIEVGLGLATGVVALAHRAPEGLRQAAILTEAGGGLVSGVYLSQLAERGVKVGGVWVSQLMVTREGRTRRLEVLQITEGLGEILPLDTAAGRTLAGGAGWRRGGCEALWAKPREAFRPEMLRIQGRSCEVAGVLSRKAMESLWALGYRPEMVVTAEAEGVVRNSAMAVFLGLVRMTQAEAPAVETALGVLDQDFRQQFPREAWKGGTLQSASGWLAQRWSRVARQAVGAAAAFGAVGLAVAIVLALGPLLLRRSEIAVRRVLGASNVELGWMLLKETSRRCVASILVAGAVILVLGESLGLQWLAAPAAVGSIVGGLILGLLLWGATWAWVTLTGTEDIAGALRGGGHGRSAGGKDARRGLGSLVVVQGAAVFVLACLAQSVGEEFRGAVASRLMGNLSGLVGVEVLRPVEDRWIQGRTEEEARSRFSALMREDLARIADRVRPWTVDGKVGAVWPRNWEGPVPLADIELPGAGLVGRERQARLRLVGGDAFEVLGLPLIAGAGCASGEGPVVPAAVADRAFVARFFGAREWRGTVVGLAGDNRTYRLSGIVGGGRGREQFETEPTLYLCEAGNGWVLLFRPRAGGVQTGYAILDELRAMYPTLTGSVSIPEAEVASGLAHLEWLRRIYAAAAGAALGLLMLTQLAAVSLLLTSGERETAIHIACGATPFRALVPFGAWLLKVTVLAGFVGWLALAWWSPQTGWKVAVGIGWGGLLVPVLAGISVAWLRIRRMPVSDLLRWS